MRELFVFLIYPRVVQARFQWKPFLTILGFSLAVVVVSKPLLLLLDYLFLSFGYEIFPGDTGVERATSSPLLPIIQERPFISFGKICLAAILEESFFRLPLRSSRVNYIVALASLGLVISISYNIYWIEIVAAFLIIAFLILRFYKKVPFFENASQQPALWIVYTSATLFSLAHLVYFKGSTLLFDSYNPISYLPYFISGLVFSYTRLKYGYKYGVLLHILSNCIPLFGLLTLLALKHYL